MNLQNISDDVLLVDTFRLARDERHLLTHLLHHLREIERRRLFVTLGYRSLFAYAVGQLGYSEDQAYRRVAAMKVMKELPEIESRIAGGALNLFHISRAKVAFRRLNAARDQKLEILAKLEHKSSREADRILAEYIPNVKPDRIRAADSELMEFRFAGPRSILSKLTDLKGLLAHKYPEPNLGQLFEILCDIALNALRPATLRDRPRQSKAEIRRRVRQKAGFACERCGSRHALEIDHIIPKAKGGTDEESNLRLLCRQCNQRAAIEEFGADKMEEFLN